MRATKREKAFKFIGTLLLTRDPEKMAGVNEMLTQLRHWEKILHVFQKL